MRKLLILLFQLVYLFISSTVQDILILPESVTILENQDVNFSCSYNNHSATAVAFVRWEERYENHSLAFAVTSYPNCSINLQINSTAITSCIDNYVYYVTWKNVPRRIHNQRIKCIMSINGTLKDSKNEALVIVNVPVEYINITFSNKVYVDVNESDTIPVRCVTSPSRPRSNISCFVQKRLNDGNRTYIGTANHSTEYEDSITTTLSFLQYRASRRDNNHFIICTASNMASIPPVESNTLHLNVKYPPHGPPAIDIHGPGYQCKVIEHHNVTLTCTSFGGNPLAQLNWMCDKHLERTELVIEDTDIIKMIMSWNASKESNTVCNCSSRHALALTSFSPEVEITVLYPPERPTLTVTVNNNSSQEVHTNVSVIHIVENTTVALNCSSKSEPPLQSAAWTGPHTSESGHNVIRMIQRYQSGTYSCRVTNIMKPNFGSEIIGNATRSLDVFILYPPVPIENSTMSFIEGHVVNVSCLNDSGNPTDNIVTWSPQGEISADHTVLFMSNITRMDDATYTCTVDYTMNPFGGSVLHGRMARQIHLEVLYPPNLPEVKISYAFDNRSQELPQKSIDITVIENSTLVLECSTQSNPPPFSTTWIRLHESSSSNRTLLLHTIKRHQKGNYTCYVNNSMKVADADAVIGGSARRINICVLYPPTVLENTTITAIEGNMVKVPCFEDHGNPTDKYVQWLPIGETPGDYSMLSMANASRNDDKNYTCVVNYTMEPFGHSAVNGFIKRQIHLNVVYKAVVKHFYIEGHERNDSVTVTENNTVTFACRINSNPTSTTTLHFRDNKIHPDKINGSVFSFTRASVGCTEAGSYTCSGLNTYNDGAPSQMNLTLLVKCPPRLSPSAVLFENVTSALKAKATINYTTLAFPMPGPSGFKWEVWNSSHWVPLKNNSNLTILSSGLESKLIFLNVSLSDYGQYRLRITNGFPEYIQTFSLVQIAAEYIFEDAKPYNMAGTIVGIICGIIVINTGLGFGVYAWRKRNLQTHEKRVEIGRLVYQNVPFSGKPAKKSPSSKIPTTEETSFHGLQELDDDPPLYREPTEYYNSPEKIEQIQRLRVSELLAYLSTKSEESFGIDYQKLPTGLQNPCTSARRPENIALNRYNGIYPYDHSRVKISGQPDFFINACYIDGYTKPNAYIASLGPTRKTTYDFKTFWMMVWNEQADIIVMLTNLMEPSGMKCEQYWPKHGSTILYGDIQVFCEREDVFAEYTTRFITISKADNRRRITHLHYTAWPDKKVPEDVTTLIEFRESAGIGRTGTLIALDRLIEEGQCKCSVDVFKCVNSMREQRVKMVQTLEQYIYIYKALVNSLYFECEMVPLESFQEYVDETNNNIYSKQFQQLKESVETCNKEESKARLANEQLVYYNHHGHSSVIFLSGSQHRVYLNLNQTMDYAENINVVYINSFKKKDHFIIAHSPLPDSVSDFLCIIYHENCCCVVTMEDLKEPGMSIGHFLASDGRTRKYGDLKVSCKTLETKPQYTVREMRVKYSGKHDGGEKVVYHFQYNKWMPGHDTPEDAKEFVQFVKDVEEYADQLGEETSHVLVHCLKAHERSALYCVVALLIEKIKYERQVSVLNTARHLRTRRRSAITSMEQLKFCYQAVSGYITLFEP